MPMRVPKKFWHCYPFREARVFYCMVIVDFVIWFRYQ